MTASNQAYAELAVEPHEDKDWRICGPGRTCQRLLFADGRRRACRRPAVMELNRRRHWSNGLHNQWWAYCEQHTYGRVIRNGRIFFDPDGHLGDVVKSS